MLRRAYDWTMGLAGRRHALPLLALVAFVESSVFPIPPDVMLVPMVLAARERAFTIAAVCTAASVLGGLLGYAIGAVLFESVGRPLLGFYGGADVFASFRDTYNSWGLWIVFTAGLTPLPYKVFTILSGVTQLDVTVFVLGSAVSRGARFFLEAALLWRFGAPIRAFVERHLGTVAAAFLVLLLGGFVVARLLA